MTDPKTPRDALAPSLLAAMMLQKADEPGPLVNHGRAILPFVEPPERSGGHEVAFSAPGGSDPAIAEKFAKPETVFSCTIAAHDANEGLTPEDIERWAGTLKAFEVRNQVEAFSGFSPLQMTPSEHRATSAVLAGTLWGEVFKAVDQIGTDDE